MAKFGIALGSGPRGLGFESRYSDQIESSPVSVSFLFSFDIQIMEDIMLTKIKQFIAKETVLCVAAGCALITMFIIPPSVEYLHYIDFRVLCLLLCLMAVVAGMKAVGVLRPELRGQHRWTLEPQFSYL